MALFENTRAVGTQMVEDVRKILFWTTIVVQCIFFAFYGYEIYVNYENIVFLIFYLHGGCTGSTTGSVKIFRWQVIAAFFKKNAVKSLSPNQVIVMKTGDKIIDDNVVSSVFVLVFGFIFAIILLTLILCLNNIDFVTAIGAVSACVTNAGIGLTEQTGPSGDFSSFSDVVKYILSFAMVLGRLEVVSVLLLLSKIKLTLKV